MANITNRCVGALIAAALCIFSLTVSAKDDYRIAWSIYVGWMPWGYAQESGIVDKWARKYGITIEVVQFNDYIESINQYTAGAFDGCTMTNMDALTIPAAGGVDSTALIVGDFSNGNDGIVLKGTGKTLADIRGQNVNLVELSVSHYLLARALASADMTERDLTVVNTSDADIVAAFSTDDVTSVVTWNPLLAEITGMPDVSPVFDSSMIPGEIIDMLVVSTEAAEDERLGKALVGAWYETLAAMSAEGPEADAAKTHMAVASGTDLAGYNAQLAATQMFYTAEPAVEFVGSAALRETMANVAAFSFEHGLLGEGAPDAGFIGVELPGGEVLGSKANVKLRFSDRYMKLAADGET
ncbi:MAG: putative urea ABC transporter substrate-binding protein [Gammaproteobacteria bacterium]|nr:putative urea ABC transporter substrate-binding protein [Gammaproteobacteria bacterium]